MTRKSVTDYYDYDEDQQQDPGNIVWIYLWTYDRNHPLTRFCIGVVVCALVGWFLIQLLTP